jgi:hypothetical protein
VDTIPQNTLVIDAGIGIYDALPAKHDLLAHCRHGKNLTPLTNRRCFRDPRAVMNEGYGFKPQLEQLVMKFHPLSSIHAADGEREAKRLLPSALCPSHNLGPCVKACDALERTDDVGVAVE